MAQVPLRRKNSNNGPDSNHVSIGSELQKTKQASSAITSEASDFMGVVDPSSPPSQVDVRVGDDEFDDSEKMIECTVENERDSKYWDTVSEFASEITKAAGAALLGRGTSFKRVVAVITYWDEATNLGYLRV